VSCDEIEDCQNNDDEPDNVDDGMHFCAFLVWVAVRDTNQRGAANVPADVQVL
jgi:hypothetical protein